MLCFFYSGSGIHINALDWISSGADLLKLSIFHVNEVSYSTTFREYSKLNYWYAT